MRFLVEASLTPIYNRIVNAFAAAIRGSNDDVIVLDPRAFRGIDAYLAAIRELHADYCLITNSASVLLQPSAGGIFPFEQIRPRLIFVHHDCIAGHFAGDRIADLFAAFVRTRGRSLHFSIERYNCLDLRRLGIDNSFPISHASEYQSGRGDTPYKYDVSFVGHILPGTDLLFDDGPASPMLAADYWNRVARPDAVIEPSAARFAGLDDPEAADLPQRLAAKYDYIHHLHSASHCMRGEVISRLGPFNIDIIGGDPAYLHKHTRRLQIQKPGLRYCPPSADYSETRRIYASSRINLNITSLQFDHAVTNRVIDVGASGGFVLTDWKSDLRAITTVSDAISYRSTEELNEKIEYYLVNEKDRRAIAAQLRHDVTKLCSYAGAWGGVQKIVEG